MNPHYNQQQPYYNYQQHIPGPPQPQWQGQPPQSPGAWNDPRLQNVSQQRPQSPHYGQNYAPIPGHPSQYQSAPPPPPPPPPPPAPVPGGAQYDTSAWGVKYHQAPYNQYHAEPQHTFHSDAKPALPPRPASVVSSLSHNSQHSHQQSINDYQQTPTNYRPQGSWGMPFQTSQEHNPPTPPPRPMAYASPSPYGQPGQVPDQYSHHASTHHYDPQMQSQPGWPQPQHHQTPSSSTSGWNHSQPMEEGPISPLEDDRRRASLVSQSTPAFVDVEPPSQNLELPSHHLRTSTTPAPVVPASSMALGGFGGGPSDWQHYDISDPHGLADEQELPTSTQAPKVTSSPLQATKSIKRKSIERMRPATNMAPSESQPQYRKQSTSNHEVQSFGPVSQPSARIPSPPNKSPQRQDSGQSAVSSISGIGRNETIDNVIQAWSKPITTDNSVQTSLPPTRTPSRNGQVAAAPKVETSDREAQTDFKPQIETRIEIRTETKEIEKDPYIDILHQYKATLNRFADMLRQEATAGTDEEKFKIFQGFVIRELRLRSVLYGVEAQPQEPQRQIEHNQEKKPEPTTPVSRAVIADRTPDQKQVAPNPQATKEQRQPTLDTKTPTTPTAKDEAFVIVNPDNDGDYSPGGRPRIAPLRIKTGKTPASTGQTSVSTDTVLLNRDNSGWVSPASNAPMTLDDYIMPEQQSPSANAPIVVGSDDFPAMSGAAQLTGPLNFQPPRPLYQPFRYEDGPNPQIPAVQVQGPSAESFAALRQNNAAESGRTLVHDAPPNNSTVAPNRGQSKTPASGRREHEEAFIGLIRAKSMAIRKTASASPRPDSPAILRAGTPASRATPPPMPVSPLVKSVQSLQSLIPKNTPPQPGPKSPPHPKLEPIVSAMQKYPDDFGFIHERMLTWDKANRQTRARHDSERQLRQSQNEEHIDQLFNDNEIGYADIAELEKDFKLTEASKKYSEDKEEFESLNHVVFDFVLEKMNGEIKELRKLQTNSIDMLDQESTSAAKQIRSSLPPSFDGAHGLPNASVSAIMQTSLQIHEMLEIRYMKIAEAKFEREGRRKRLELSILYTNNDKVGIRKLEAEFAKAKKLLILEDSRKKAERANKLMDSFDRAVVRGLAENQGVVDDILTRLQLVRDLILGSEENVPQGQAREELFYGPQGIKDLTDRVSATIEYIHHDSIALVQLLDRVDTLSNNADFELYMSESKLADASPEKFEKIKSEKQAEDLNVQDELNNRLSGISRVPNEISALIRDVKDKIGGDAGHEERIGKALEAAKKRNYSLSS